MGRWSLLALLGLVVFSVRCGDDDTTSPRTIPDIEVPGSLSMSGLVGRSATAVITVRNAGDATLEVTTIAVDQAWLSVSSAGFSVNAGSSRDMPVTANMWGLSPGTYTATITITSNDPDERQATVQVSLAVRSLLDMVWIPGGTFQMGSTSQWAYPDEQPVHTVTVSSFWMSKYEVTQAQYQEVMGENPSYFQFRGANRPVEWVTWYDAAKFCNALSAREGLTKFYNDEDLNSQATMVRMNWGANGYRLPTEAEWEYACRAGTTTDFYSGDQTELRQDPKLDAIGWYWANSDNQTHDVGLKQPNAFGLYDMSGNVYEWCNDWYEEPYPSEAQTDPTGPSSGTERVIRGGSWHHGVGACRSAYRWKMPPRALFDVGIRPVRR